MIKKCKGVPREWTKKFIWIPLFFEYGSDTYFVFLETVEHRQIAFGNGLVTIYRPCRP